MNAYRIIVADDHAIFRNGLRGILEEGADYEVVAEAGDGVELLNLLKQDKLDPHLIILDISMPNLRGLEAIHEIKTLRPHVKVLIVTMHSDREYLYLALARGADGYFLKKDANIELFAAIERLRSGKTYISPHLAENTEDAWDQIRHGFAKPTLTDREREVLTLVAEGKSNKEIANELCVSIHTVERHRANIMAKLKVKKTADLVKYAIQQGFLGSGPNF